MTGSMPCARYVRWPLLYLIWMLFAARCALASWPPPNPNGIQLLGIFRRAADTSESTGTASHALAMFNAAILLAQQYNVTVNGRFITGRVIETEGHGMDTLRSTCEAIANASIVGIVGPTLSRETRLIADFAQTVGLPVISYAATDPDLSDQTAYPALHRTVPSDAVAALAMAKLFDRYNWTSCIFIYQNDAFGTGGAQVVSDVFLDRGLVISNVLVFDILTHKFREDLKALLTFSPSRIVVVWAEASHTRRILQAALDANVLGPLFTWILTARVSLASFSEMVRPRLVGMLVIEPTSGAILNEPVNTTLLDAAYRIWAENEPDSFPGPRQVDGYALFAFDATWSLIQALQRLRTPENLSFNNHSSCFRRRLADADRLAQAVADTTFLGVSGPIQFRANSTDRVNGSYYCVRNARATDSSVDFAVVLKDVDGGEWTAASLTDVIIWPGASLTPPSGRAALAGVTLRIGMKESLPFTTLTQATDASGNETTKLVGFMPDLLDLLVERMGFIPEVELVSSNQTYNDLVDAVANGVYDMVLATVVKSAKRREKVDFSDTIFDSAFRVMVRKTVDVQIDLLSYLKPFSRELWILILASSVYATLLIYLLERGENDALNKRSAASAIAMSFWFSFSNVVGYGADFHARTAPGRIVTSALYILSLTIVASYTANLASDLTLSKSQESISGLDDIKSGKVPFNRVGLYVGGSMEEYYVREVSGGLKNYYPLRNSKELYAALFAGNIDAALIDAGSGEYVVKNVYCNLTMVGADFFRTGLGIVTPKNWLHGQTLDVNILALREAGKLDALNVKWFHSSICGAAPEVTTAMSITAMGGLFVTFAVITFLALLLFIWKKRSAMCTWKTIGVMRNIRREVRKVSIG